MLPTYTRFDLAVYNTILNKGMCQRKELKWDLNNIFYSCNQAGADSWNISYFTNHSNGERTSRL